MKEFDADQVPVLQYDLRDNRSLTDALDPTHHTIACRDNIQLWEQASSEFILSAKLLYRQKRRRATGIGHSTFAFSFLTWVFMTH